MALFHDDAGKTEKPTPQRLNEARDKGQAPLSREMVSAGTLLAAVLLLRHVGPWLIDAMQDALRLGLAPPPVALQDHDSGTLLAVLGDSFAAVRGPFLAILAGALATTLLFGYGQIGVRLSRQALGIKLDRLNPATNLSRVFNFGSVAQTLASALKLALLGGVLWLALRSRWRAFAQLQERDLGDATRIVMDTALTALLWIAVMVMLIAIADLVLQRHRFTQRLMMTKHEVEDERRRAEGDPLIKNRLRSARLEFMRQRMMEAVPQADVVVVNPTHYAVALRYDRTKHAAPQVVAKGVDDVALRIRTLARENNVPVMEDPPLARALFRAVRVGQEIPERFFKAVAAVLSHVYRLRGKVA